MQLKLTERTLKFLTENVELRTKDGLLVEAKYDQEKMQLSYKKPNGFGNFYDFSYEAIKPEDQELYLVF